MPAYDTGTRSRVDRRRSLSGTIVRFTGDFLGVCARAFEKRPSSIARSSRQSSHRVASSRAIATSSSLSSAHYRILSRRRAHRRSFLRRRAPREIGGQGEETHLRHALTVTLDASRALELELVHRRHHRRVGL